MKKYIPQFAVEIWCGLFKGHAAKRYYARSEGVQVVVYTCRCGKHQRSTVMPANRELRRMAKKL